MADLQTLDKEALESLRERLQKRFEDEKALGLALDMTRGKPCAEQCDLANGLIDILSPDDYQSPEGVDCRNYGCLDGLPGIKTIFAEILEVPADQVIVGGNSSLEMMHNTICRALTHGLPGGPGPWAREKTVRFLCPTPGYDRHFTICSHFGIEMIAVENTDTGPDMDAVEAQVKNDPTIKGIWIVPRYNNPTGQTCSHETVDRLARMKTAASDFRIFWDNAYAVHHLTETPDPLKNIYDACRDAGHPDRVFLYTSFSKVTFAGAGLGATGASPANTEWQKKHLFVQTIGPDKMNQLRHLQFFGDVEGVKAHMRKHAAILKPKFDAVLEILDRELGGKGIATWTRPRGGYFISLNLADNCAKAVVAKAAEIGVKLTKAGATYPHGHDPRDRNIRLAPTYPCTEDAIKATEVVALCIELTTVESLQITTI